MSLDEDLLTDAAQSGTIDFHRWPAIVEHLLERLNHIVHNDFPLPRPYPILTPNVSTSSDTPQHASGVPGTTLVTQTPTTPRALPPVPPFPGSASSTSNVPNSQPGQSQSAETSDTTKIAEADLPHALAQLLLSITNTLRTSFSSKPPHTIQRLAELITHPRDHYRTLPAYLRALDRVVSVSSTADTFPLADQPNLVNGVTNGELGGGILWKNDLNGYDKGLENELGSDESLGGALLTPIPWLRDITPIENVDTNRAGSEGDILAPLPGLENSSAESGTTTEKKLSPNDPLHMSVALTTPHHDPLVPERHDGAVTQGELIRMEQEAGVIPVTQSSQSSNLNAVGRGEPIPNSIALGVGIGLDDLDDDDDLGEGSPHARGPDIVGSVDIGRVGGRDVQIDIGSPPGESALEHKSPINVVDTQAVLAGSRLSEAANHHQTGPSSDDGYVHVGREIDDSDEMQVDTVESTTPEERKNSGDDEDIVLVDADGATESERRLIDEIGGQEGNDAGDTIR